MEIRLEYTVSDGIGNQIEQYLAGFAALKESSLRSLNTRVSLIGSGNYRKNNDCLPKIVNKTPSLN